MFNYRILSLLIVVSIAQTASNRLNTLFGYADNLFIGTRGDGLFRSENRGETWDEFSTGLFGDARHIKDFTVRGDSLYAGTDGSGVYYYRFKAGNYSNTKKLTLVR